MKVDALVIGAELDGAVAAMRLAELGHTVCIAAAGAGSLHYAPGGVRLLGHLEEDGSSTVGAPLAALAALGRRHPYALAGSERVGQALAWFAASPVAAALDASALEVAAGAAENRSAVTPAGLAQPVLVPAHGQATFERLTGRSVAVLQFEGHLDFPAGLLLAALDRSGIRAQRITVSPPAGRTDNLGLARAFDRTPDVSGYFARIQPLLPPGCEVALAPAVLGLSRHRAVLDAAGAGLGIAVLEVPTLPPCVRGMSWQTMNDDLLQARGCTIRRGVRIAASSHDGDRVRSVRDENGREIEAATYVVATGGVLMGGLAVSADGTIAETTFGLRVVQTSPLRADSAESALAALHHAGVETDDSFRPYDAHGQPCRNLFVTGRTLAHWHPARELSAEGVSIVTGWIAAEAAHAVLEG